jgi:hypothetical protein
MIRRDTRLLIPWPFVGLMWFIYAIVYGFQLRLPKNGANDHRLMIHVSGILMAGLVAGMYGWMRVARRHPVAEPKYRKWLEASPWRPGLPLPRGPVQLDWRDGLALMLIFSASAADAILFPPIRGLAALASIYVIAIFAIAFALAAVSIFGRCKLSNQRRAILAMLPLYLWILPHPLLVAALTAVLLGASAVGVRRSLFPSAWPSEPDPAAVRAQQIATHVLGPSDPSQPASPGQGLVTAALVAWWVFTFWRGYEQVYDPIQVPTVYWQARLFGVFCALVRLGNYCARYRWPIGPLARIATGHLIIPRYDQVFIAPLLTIAAGFIVPPWCMHIGLSLPASLAVGVATMLAASLEIGPSLRRWQFTAAHRIRVAGPAMLQIEDSEE